MWAKKTEDKQGKTDCRQGDSEQAHRCLPGQPDLFLPGETRFGLGFFSGLFLQR